MKLRHVFYTEPPENIVNVDPLPYIILHEETVNQPNVFMDVQIYNGEVEILGWGCVIDGEEIKPVWVTPEILEREKANAMTLIQWNTTSIRYFQ